MSGSAIDAEAIRTAREALNEALVARDPAVFARYWDADLRAIVGGDGGMLTGYGNNVERYGRLFADPDFVSGRRTPERIDVGISSEGRIQAAESGQWVWRLSKAGTPFELRGRYLVFWRKTGPEWKIWQETYVTTTCHPTPPCAAPTSRKTH